VFFVDHHEPEARHRREHHQPRAEHDVGLAHVRQQPGAQALCRRQCAVHRHHAPRREALHHARQQLWREVDLGHQQQHLPATHQRALGRAQVDLGLAAAGHAVQQQWRSARHRRSGFDRVDCGRLLGRERRQQRLASIVAVARWRAARTLQTLRELRRVQATQLGRQHAQRQLPERALVVAGRKLHQRHPRLAQRRHRIEHLCDRAQRGVGRRAGGRGLPDQTGHIALSKRHPHQGARGQRDFVLVVQRVAQARMPRRLHHDLHACITHMQSCVSTFAAKWLIEQTFQVLRGAVDNFVGKTRPLRLTA
jgi:hypothetical protein